MLHERGVGWNYAKATGHPEMNHHASVTEVQQDVLGPASDGSNVLSFQGAVETAGHRPAKSALTDHDCANLPASHDRTHTPYGSFDFRQFRQPIPPPCNDLLRPVVVLRRLFSSWCPTRNLCRTRRTPAS